MTHKYTVDEIINLLIKSDGAYSFVINSFNRIKGLTIFTKDTYIVIDNKECVIDIARTMLGNDKYIISSVSPTYKHRDFTKSSTTSILYNIRQIEQIMSKDIDLNDSIKGVIQAHLNAITSQLSFIDTD